MALESLPEPHPRLVDCYPYITNSTPPYLSEFPKVTATDFARLLGNPARGPPKSENVLRGADRGTALTPQAQIKPGPGLHLEEIIRKTLASRCFLGTPFAQSLRGFREVAHLSLNSGTEWE